MVLMMLERVTPSMRGELSRWLIQPRSGVFVGKVSALVRDKLWDAAVKSLASMKPRKSGTKPGAIMVYTTNNEQGFAFRVTGETDREIADFEGLLLAKTHPRA